MKKRTVSKLSLSKETLFLLERPEDLSEVMGGTGSEGPFCYSSGNSGSPCARPCFCR